MLKRHRDRNAADSENPRFVNVFFTELDTKGKVLSVTYLKNQLLCTYLQLYNYDHGQLLDPLRSVLEQRIDTLFRFADPASLANDIIAHEPLYVTVSTKNTKCISRGSASTIGYGLAMDKVQRKGLRLDQKNNKIKVVHG